jgi:Tol biopolymer transport system component
MSPRPAFALTTLTLVFLVSLAALGAVLAAQSAEADLQRAVQRELATGDLNASINEYLSIAKRAGASNPAVAARAQLRAADAQAKKGDRAAALAAYRQLVATYTDQPDVVAQARARLSAAQTPAASTATGSTARLIWSGPEIGGRLSPDGRYLSFHMGATGDLGLRDLTTNTTRNLTNTGGWVASGDYVEESVVSPDSRQVAYTWFVEKDRRYEVRILSIDTAASGAPRTVLRPESADDYTGVDTWTPDGRQLLVRRQRKGAWEIGSVSVDDGSYRTLKSLEWRDTSLRVSPDGRHIAYAVPAAGNGSPRDIHLLALDGSLDTALVQHPGNDLSPFWSPDGSRVLFVSDRSGPRALWSQPVTAGRAAGDATPVRPNPLADGVNLLGMSRSGALYYVKRGATRTNVYIADFDGAVANPQSRRGIGSTTHVNRGPAWSRDGRYLAYYSAYNPAMGARPPETRLVIRDMTTSADRAVTLPPNVENTPLNPGPKWFPDNRTLLILAREPEGAGLGFYRLDSDSGRSDLLWRITSGTQSFDLSSDGRFIYRQGPNQLVRYDIENRRESVLATDATYTAVSVSPDGSRLAALRSIREKAGEAPGVITLRPSSGGTAQEIYRHPIWYDGTRFNTLAWAPDGRFLLFGRPEGDTPFLWRVPVSGGEPEKIGFSGDIKTPAIRPGGKQIAFALRETDDNEVWMLENLLTASRVP